MKTLVVTPYDPALPGRDVYGVYQRFAMFVRALARLSARVDILHIVGQASPAWDADPDALSQAQSDHYGVPVRVTLAPNHQRRETAWNHYAAGMLALHQQPVFHHYGHSAQVHAVEAAMQGRPDLVFVHRLGAMCPVLRVRGMTGRIFFDLDDIEHRVRLRHALSRPRRLGKLLYAAHVPAIHSAERRAAALAEATFVCSETDQHYLRRCGVRSNIVVIPNAVALPDQGQPLAPAPTLLFLGNYSHEPNRLAADRLAAHIFPLIRAQAPAARLLIAGGEPERLRSHASAAPGVEFTGHVGDLAALYARTRVVCCPLTIGGGTRVKLIEAAGFAKPMVSTKVGAEGLAFADGREILLRDSDADFAAACIRLLADDTLALGLGAAARAKAKQHYQRSRIEDGIIQLMQHPLTERLQHA